MGHSSACRGFVSAMLAALLPISSVHALSWSALPPAGSAPGATSMQCAIYDPVAQRLVDYQTLGASGSSTDFLLLGGTPTWTSAAITGPTPDRYACGTIYDPVRRRMLVFGGTASGGARNEVWALSLGATPAWTEVTTAGTPPDPRTSATAIYDAPRDRMIVYAGTDGGYNGTEDVWELSLGGTPTWTQLAPSGGPGFGRTFQSAIFDPVRQRMIVFGGNRGSALAYDILGDVWALSLNGTPAWTELTPSGGGPTPREGHSAVYDPVRDRMLVFGGDDGSTASDEVWELTLGATPQWNALAPTGPRPPGRYLEALIYDSERDQLVLYGGGSYSAQFADVWALPLGGTTAVGAQSAVNEVRLAAPSPNPAVDGTSFTFALPRAAHARLALYDPAGRRVRTLLDEDVAAGTRSVRWDLRTPGASRVAAGIYLAALEVDGIRHCRLVVVRD